MVPTKRLFKAIEASLEEENLDKLNGYLLSTNNNSEAFNLTTLNLLSNMLKKKEKVEVKRMHADCVLSCLQHFVDGNDAEKWLILAKTVAELCDLVFSISIKYIKCEDLVQKNITTFYAIIEVRKEIANYMLQFTAESLLRAGSTESMSVYNRVCVLALLSTLLQQTSQELRSNVIPSKIMLLNALSNSLPSCGDYEGQAAIMEVLARCLRFIPGSELFTTFPGVMEMFKSYTYLNFDPECRLFLNKLNNRMGTNQSVYSIPCSIVSINGIRYTKPKDSAYREFWVDFNVQTKRVTFYYQECDSDDWELMKILGMDILEAVAENSKLKSKIGETIPVVKLQIRIKGEESSEQETKVLKIYARKSKLLEKLEKNAIRDIFQDKYKTHITYEELYKMQDETPPGRERQIGSVSESAEENISHNSTAISQVLDGTAAEEVTVINHTEALKSKQTEISSSCKKKDEGIPKLSESSKDQEDPEDNSLERHGKHTEKINTPENLNLSSEHNSSKRRRLFSNKSDDVNNIIMSSLEDCSAEIPNYKLQLKDVKVTPVKYIDRSNVTFSYIREKKENQKTKSVSQPQIYSDLEDEATVISANKTMGAEMKDSTQKMCLSDISFSSARLFCEPQKKSIAINKTPDGVAQADLFPSKSEYFPQPENKSRYSKTYSRPKPKKTRKRKEWDRIFQSDSDSDAAPNSDDFDSIFSSPQKTETTDLKKNKIKRPKLKMFVDQLPARIDPVRDAKHRKNIKMQIEPENANELKEIPIKLDVYARTTDLMCEAPKRGRGRKANISENINETITKKSTSNVRKIRKPRGNKVLDSDKKPTSNTCHQLQRRNSPKLFDDNEETDKNNHVHNSEGKLDEDAATSADTKQACSMSLKVPGVLVLPETVREMDCPELGMDFQHSLSTIQALMKKQSEIVNDLQLMFNMKLKELTEVHQLLKTELKNA